MKKIVIFSGTTEGRRLSEELAHRGMTHTVCVAGAYGEEVMHKDPYVHMHVGRMNAEEMVDFLRSVSFDADGILVDATHPYATQVTANIRHAADVLHCRYLRVLRAESDRTQNGERVFRDITECAEALSSTEGNILLTTGSKELSAFHAAAPGELLQRTYVRVLPTSESLALCTDAGIEPMRVIAMHGPFTKEMNLAILRQYDIRHLVTKESGCAGGYTQKAEAAAEAGARLYVIARPTAGEEGVGVSEALRELISSSPAPDSSDHSSDGTIELTLAGAGMGNPSGLTQEVREAVAEADVLFGAGRILAGIPTDLSAAGDQPASKGAGGPQCSGQGACPAGPVRYEMYRPEEILPVLEDLSPTKAVILYSGDTGFYSGAAAMLKAIGQRDSRIRVRVLPGISSVACLSAKLGIPYDDAALCSLHGKASDEDLRKVIRRIRHERKVFVLLSGAEDIRRIAAVLLEETETVSGHAEAEHDARHTDASAGERPSVRIFAGARLSMSGERITELTLSEAASYDEEGIVTACILNEAPARRLLVPVCADTDFLRETKVPMTKEVIRHESIRRLMLREGDIFYDIGAGTGSVAIEAALLDPSVRVTAIERDAARAALIMKNAEKNKAMSVRIVEGDAVSVLADLERPDCVFIGGSGGKLEEILDLLRNKGNGIRCVINAVSLETMAQIRRILEERNICDPELVQIGVNELRTAGTSHLMQAQNPVMIFSFTL